METAVSSIVKFAFSIVEFIGRRVAIKACAYAADHAEAHRQTLNDIKQTIEKDTALILNALNSRQQAKLKSAYQQIEMALSDLELWNAESDGQTDTTSVESNQPSAAMLTNALAISQSIASKSALPNAKSPKTSRYLQLAMQRLYDADKLAMDIFNDDKNSSAYMRIDALHLRVFCQTLLYWDNKKSWFDKWKLVLTKLFDDKDLFNLALGQQSSLSKLLSRENAKMVSEQFESLMKCLRRMIWSMLVSDGTLCVNAHEFSKFVAINISAKQTKMKTSAFSGTVALLSRSKSFTNSFSLLLLCSISNDFAVVYDRGYTEILAVDNDNVLVYCDTSIQLTVIDIEQRFIKTKPEMFYDNDLLSIAYACRTKEIFVLCRMQCHLHVLNMSLGVAYQLPDDVISKTDNYRLRSTPKGTLFVSKNDGQKNSVKFCNSNDWLDLTDNSPKNYQLVFDDNNHDNNSIIGMRIFDNMVVTDCIRCNGSTLSIKEKQREVLNLKNKPIRWIISPPSTNGYGFRPDVWAIGYYSNNSICICRIRNLDCPQGGHESFSAYPIDVELNVDEVGLSIDSIHEVIWRSYVEKFLPDKICSQDLGNSCKKSL